MKNTIEKLVSKISQSHDCIVLPPSGLPNVDTKLFPLSLDVCDFYTVCGGLALFVSSEHPMRIVKPDEVVLSNPLILPPGWERDTPVDDISNSWYVIADAGLEQRISIDLNNKRLGKCYDSFWDIHSSPGESPIISISFTKLLESIFANKGEYWFWLSDNFVSLGDAYD